MKMNTLLPILAVILLASACNTFEGLGQDVQKGGSAIEKSADKNK